MSASSSGCPPGAQCSIRAGDSAAAVGRLLRIDRWPLPQLGGVRGPVALELARAFAIGGDVEKAERWLDTARTRLENDPRGNQDEAIALVDGLIRCRAGRFEEALRHYDDSWQRLQAKLTVRDMQEAWLLRAFAVSKTSAPRDGAAAEPWLRLLRGTEPGSFAWLTRHWPELEMFVDHEVRAASARTAAAPSTSATPAADRAQAAPGSAGRSRAQEFLEGARPRRGGRLHERALPTPSRPRQ